LPLVDRSLSELIDLGSEFATKFDAMAQNPAGTLQALETLIRQTFGITSGPPILSWVPASHTVNIDFSFAKNIQIARPFNLDLASAGLPAFLTNLVGVSASGNVDVRASLQLDIKLGLDLDGTDGTTKGFF